MKIKDVVQLMNEYKRRWKIAKSKERQSYNYNQYMHLFQMLKLSGRNVNE